MSEKNKKDDAIKPQDGQPALDYPVVGMGASAGGLEAYEAFFDHFPDENQPDIAFVLIQHLDPQRESMLAELIQRHTWMQVLQARDGVQVKPKHVYIIPPNKDLTLVEGKLKLSEPSEPHGMRLPIDHFLRSLAQYQAEFAVCIVLSGTGSDGTLGAKAVKEAGGLVIAQDPETIRHDGMPTSLIANDLADLILPVERIPEQLVAYTRGYLTLLPEGMEAEISSGTMALLRSIFAELRKTSGTDFSHYKINTVRRRIERRMAVHQIDDLKYYVQYLKRSPEEVETLYRDLLIGVTNFFRDPEAFQVLAEKIIPQIIANKPKAGVIRVWVPGCSTGEEAYSVAILLREQMDKINKDLYTRIYATDIDERAIEVARQGRFLTSIRADVSPERLERYFREEDGKYQVAKIIREMVVFARQDISTDPPFSRLDLICCRNLLIYMDSKLQKKIIPLFHYALRPSAFLFLGSSESIGDFVDLFDPLDNKWKIYQRKAGLASRALPEQYPHTFFPTLRFTENKPDKQNEHFNMKAWVERKLLDEHTPPSVLINGKGDVLFIHGRTGKYLEPPQGETSVNLLRMVRPGLRQQVSEGLRRAASRNENVRYEQLTVRSNGEDNYLNLMVKPVDGPGDSDRVFLVVFEKVEKPGEIKREAYSLADGDQETRVVELERALLESNEHLETVIEELETSNEELKSTNEELQSANEELQSTNEELETSKEETQSINEELVTVNTELQEKVKQLTQANDDLNNLMAVTGIGTIFVDMNMRITRYTPAVTDIVNLIEGDRGRPLGNITSNLRYENLLEDVQQVLDTLHSKEIEAQSKDDKWYLIRLLPYRTLENVIQGVVITFVDITAQKMIEEEMQKLSKENEDSRLFIENVLDTVREALVVLDSELRVVSVNRSFYDTFQVKPNQTVGKLLYNLGNQQWDIPELRELLEEILPDQTTIEGYYIQHDFSKIGNRTMKLNAREIKQDAGNRRMILLAIEDVSGVDGKG